jgi:hypothetical protein
MGANSKGACQEVGYITQWKWGKSRTKFKGRIFSFYTGEYRG